MKPVISEIQDLWVLPFFSKCSKFNADFENVSKTLTNIFSFWGSGICFGIVEFSLLGTGYLSSAANVLTSRSNICYVNKGGFFQLNCLETDQWRW